MASTYLMNESVHQGAKKRKSRLFMALLKLAFNPGDLSLETVITTAQSGRSKLAYTFLLCILILKWNSSVTHSHKQELHS